MFTEQSEDRRGLSYIPAPYTDTRSYKRNSSFSDLQWPSCHSPPPPKKKTSPPLDASDLLAAPRCHLLNWKNDTLEPGEEGAVSLREGGGDVGGVLQPGAHLHGHRVRSRHRLCGLRSPPSRPRSHRRAALTAERPATQTVIRQRGGGAHLIKGC